MIAQIRSKDGYRYTVTDEDLLWLARSVQAEGGDHAATIWTYAQRQAHFRRRSSLTSLLRAHSQPINPLWADPNAGKCLEYPSRCEPRSIAARARATSRTWNEISPEVRSKVLAWTRGELPNPAPRAVDFADPTVSASFLRRVPGARVVLNAGNWYIALRETLAWPADYVTMDADIGTSSMRWWIGGLGLATAGLALLWWRRRR